MFTNIGYKNKYQNKLKAQGKQIAIIYNEVKFNLTVLVKQQQQLFFYIYCLTVNTCTATMSYFFSD